MIVVVVQSVLQAVPTSSDASWLHNSVSSLFDLQVATCGL